MPNYLVGTPGVAASSTTPIQPAAATTWPTSTTEPSARVYFKRERDAVVLSAQYNPEAIEEDLAVAYSEAKVMGLSHKVLQYENTDNYQCSFDLAFDAFGTGSSYGTGNGNFNGVKGIPLATQITGARNYLMSLCYPSEQASSIKSGAPTRVMFCWPGLISLTAVVKKLKFKHKRFAWYGLDLASTWFICSVTIEEIRDTTLTSEQVAAHGPGGTSTK